jgi:hypothetical protein
VLAAREFCGACDRRCVANGALGATCLHTISLAFASTQTSRLIVHHVRLTLPCVPVHLWIDPARTASPGLRSSAATTRRLTFVGLVIREKHRVACARHGQSPLRKDVRLAFRARAHACSCLSAHSVREHDAVRISCARFASHSVRCPLFVRPRYRALRPSVWRSARARPSERVTMQSAQGSVISTSHRLHGTCAYASHHAH